MGTEPRAEDIIAEIYKQAKQLKTGGVSPTSVLLPYRFIRRLRIYKFLIGELPNEGIDYLQAHSIFELEFYVHDDEEIVVQ